MKYFIYTLLLLCSFDSNAITADGNAVRSYASRNGVNVSKYSDAVWDAAGANKGWFRGKAKAQIEEYLNARKAELDKAEAAAKAKYKSGGSSAASASAASAEDSSALLRVQLKSAEERMAELNEELVRAQAAKSDLERQVSKLERDKDLLTAASKHLQRETNTARAAVRSLTEYSVKVRGSKRVGRVMQYKFRVKKGDRDLDVWDGTRNPSTVEEHVRAIAKRSDQYE